MININRPHVTAIFRFQCVALFFLLVAKLYPAPTDSLFFTNDPNGLLKNSKQSILVIPLDAIQEEFFHNARMVPDTYPRDSFFIESANGLISYECSRYFAVRGVTDDIRQICDSLHVFCRTGISPRTSDSAPPASVSDIIKTVAEKCGADLVLLPRQCTITHVTFQQKAWSDAPEYQKPVKYFAKVRIHVQIWDKNGDLLYERIGKDKTKRPVFYAVFKKESPKKGENIDSFAKRYYAPPAMRCLSAAIVKAMKINVEY